MHVPWCETLWYPTHFSFGSWKRLLTERPFSLWQKRWRLCQVGMLMAFVYHFCVIYDFYPSSSCPSRPKYLLWQKGTELLPNGVCFWKSQTWDVQSSNQAQSNEYPPIKGMSLWQSKYSGHSLIFSFLSFQVAIQAFYQFCTEITCSGLF